MDNGILPPKRSKVAIDGDSLSVTSGSQTDEQARRKQVDAHVQAFLKAVLNHAHGRTQKIGKPKSDASTQTEDSYIVDDNNLDDINVSSDILVSGCVPNLEMYSQETRHIACQQGAYYTRAHDELSSDQQSTLLENYSTGTDGTFLDPSVSKANKLSSNKIRQEINDWVEKYQHWFYQNFGVDVRTASLATQVISQTPTIPVSLPNIFEFPIRSQPTTHIAPICTTTNEPSSTVISRPPVQYVVPEGSLLVSNNGVSPYVSLIPSFYTPDAFQRTTTQPQPSMQLAFDPVYIQSGHQNPQSFFIVPNPISPQAALVNQLQVLPNASMPSVSLCPNLSCTQFSAVDLSTLVPHSQSTAITTVATSQLSFPTNPLATAINVPPVENSTNFCYAPSATTVQDPFTDLASDLQTSAMLAALVMPLSSSSKQKHSFGQWGPLLRYGTYGRLPSPSELRAMHPDKMDTCVATTPLSVSTAASSSVVSDHFGTRREDKMPPPPPTFILLRRQAMICALQLSCRDRGQELLAREKENISGLPINYPSELDRVVEKSIGIRPVYLFTKLIDLPHTERRRFLGDDWECQGMLDVSQHHHDHHHHPRLQAENHISTRHQLQLHKQQHVGSSSCSSRTGDLFSPSHMYCCDLLIGDVLVAEACTTYKQQARYSVARQAFRTLAKPCFLVGSIRTWEEIEYLVLCLSSKAELVPKLPPFLSDPFESLNQKDRAVNTSNPDESFEITNPKPIEDFWLYIAMHPLEASYNDYTMVERFLAQSAEFSQMTISFEVETNFETGQFVCTGLVDAIQLGLATASTVVEAQRQAASQLWQSLVASQPIVGHRITAFNFDASYEPWNPLWCLPERVLVDALMWGKEELDLAINIEQLEAHCEVSTFQEVEQSNDETIYPQPNTQDDVQGWSPSRLDHWLQAYAASALVTPLLIEHRVAPRFLWPFVRQSASNWGLLIQERSDYCSVLVCKRTPLPRLKCSLYTTGSFNCFQLISKGALSDGAINRLLSADPVLQGPHESEIVSPSPESSMLSRSSVDQMSSTLVYHEEEEDSSYLNEPVTRLARHFLATGSSSATVKQEPGDRTQQNAPLDDCVIVTAELNQPSNAIEILDDLPRTLIPGIDF